MTDLPDPGDWPVRLPDCAALDRLADPDENGDGQVTRDTVLNAARWYLWQWTGRMYGLSTLTVRPARQDVDGTTYGGGRPPGAHPTGPTLAAYSFGSAWLGHRWGTIGCGACGAYCSCDALASIVLPGPVYEVDEVTIDGDTLDPSAYRVDGRSRLVREDGGRWPAVQRLDRPAGDPDTWTVTYRRGRPVPEQGQVAAGVLACEMAKAVRGDGDCALPQRLQTVTREGVTVGIVDSFEDLADGRTGVWVVDAFIAAATRPRRRPSVMSPDYRGTTATR